MAAGAPLWPPPGQAAATVPRETVGADDEPGTHVQTMRVGALEPDPGVEMDLLAAEPPCLLDDPIRRRRPYRRRRAAGNGREIVDLRKGASSGCGRRGTATAKPRVRTRRTGPRADGPRTAAHRRGASNATASTGRYAAPAARGRRAPSPGRETSRMRPSPPRRPRRAAQDAPRSRSASGSDLSLRSVCVSIWRMRSRVTPNARPTSSSVRGSSPSSP